MSVFFKKDRLYSRSFRGFCGVVSVLLGLMAGYGLMFVCGVPLTQMTQVRRIRMARVPALNSRRTHLLLFLDDQQQILPFVIFGIGLDDVFILTCSYDRNNHHMDPVERIHGTIDDVGISITMTTLTSAIAFGLGCLSSIPAVFWLCLYGFPTIALVFLYQLTFFVACIVLDEERIQAHRQDCCFCRKVEVTDDDQEPPSESLRRDSNTIFMERLMGGYAKFLLRPWVKCAVTIGFLAIAGACAYSASLLKQVCFDEITTSSVLRESNNHDHVPRRNSNPKTFFRKIPT